MVNTLRVSVYYDANMVIITFDETHFTHAFVDFITKVKIVGGCYTEGSTATFIAGVSTSVWQAQSPYLLRPLRFSALVLQ
jgi:hypothetical protein